MRILQQTSATLGYWATYSNSYSRLVSMDLRSTAAGDTVVATAADVLLYVYQRTRVWRALVYNTTNYEAWDSASDRIFIIYEAV